MRGHLAPDGITAATHAAATFLLFDDDDRKRRNALPILLGLVAFETGAALLTRTQPSPTERADQPPLVRRPPLASAPHGA